MHSVRELCKIESGFAEKVKVEFVGNVNSSFRKYVEEDETLRNVTAFRDTLSHDDLLQLYGETDVQLLVLAHTFIAPGNLPGKLFEYLASGNFILGIGPTKGDAAAVLKETNAGIILESGDHDGIKDAIMKSYFEWRDGPNVLTLDVSKYTRKNLTRQLTTILESLQ
jgi:glycosyltransferase involved in cell wall biosynthesis